MTRDTLLGGRVILLQPEKGYRVAIDPVLLAASVPAETGQSVLDAGCGTGAVLFCLAARVPGLALAGLDVSSDSLSLAGESAQLNDLEVEFIQGDLLAGTTLDGRQFDHVVSNPPFWNSEGSNPSPDPGKRQANAMPLDQLGPWVKACASALKHKGLLSMILPTALLASFIASMPGSLGSVSITPFWPKKGQPSKRVVIQAVKGGSAQTVLHPGVLLHGEDGVFTDRASALLKTGAALSETR